MNKEEEKINNTIALKDILDISKYTMKLILEEAINKEKERIDKLTDRIIELRRSRNDK